MLLFFLSFIKRAHRPAGRSSTVRKTLASKENRIEFMPMSTADYLQPVLQRWIGRLAHAW
jgi:hypothetical protein